MKQKRWILLEVPEDGIASFCPQCGFNVRVDLDDCCIHCGATARGSAVDSFEVITGPVELMQAACKEAGVKYTTPQKGDWFMYCDMTWHTSALNPEDFEGILRLVIPASPEPCPNCQNAKSYGHVYASPKRTQDEPWKCRLCGRPEREWTYSEPEWGGIGSGLL